MFRAQEDNPYQVWQNKQNGAGGIQAPQPGVVPVQDDSQLQPAVMPGGVQMPDQQQAINQAIQGNAPGLNDVMSNIKFRGGNGEKVKPGKMGTLGNIAGGAATGAQLGSAVPVLGTAVGAIAGGLYGGIKSLGGMRKGQQTDMSAGDYNNAVDAAYRTSLGREQSPEEKAANAFKGGKWVNQNQWQNNLNNIASSPEAQAFQAKQAQPQVAAQAAPQQAALAQAINGGQAGKGILEGFNNDKLANAAHADKSPKYAFAAIAGKYDQSDPAQRQAMLAELKQNKFFKNATLGGSKGDILDVGEGADGAFGGIRQFDVVRAAGEGGKAWQWGERGGDSGGAPTGGSGIGADYNASGDPILAAVGGQSLNPVTMGMDRLKQLLAGIPGGINGILGGGQ